jgi:hypothetical protein
MVILVVWDLPDQREAVWAGVLVVKIRKEIALSGTDFWVVP